MMRKILKGQRGFTLIELLVAVGIVAIIAGVAIPMVTRFIGTAEQSAEVAELTTVQTAVDAMMTDKLLADLGPTNCTALVETIPTNDMAAFPCSDVVLAPTGEQPYIRVEGNHTDCYYTAAIDGTVTQLSTCTPVP